MSSKIFMANKGIGGLNFHAYIVYDADGDLNTIDDQLILSGHPEQRILEDGHLLPDGPIVIEVDFENTDENGVKSNDSLYVDSNGDGVVDKTDTTSIRNYTELTIPQGETADSLWAKMVDYAVSL